MTSAASTTADAAAPVSLAPARTRIFQLVLGILGMVMIANLQYGWTLFVGPLSETFKWKVSDIQIAFTIFIVTETWLVPVQGYVIDRLGPTLTVMAGGVMIGASWILNSMAGSLTTLYVAAAIGGTGAGAIYGATIGSALKWFPDRRGLAAGFTAAGFGAGSALTILPISYVIDAHGYAAAFLWFGLGQGLVTILIALLLRAPKPGEVPEVHPARRITARDHTPVEMAKTPVFWLMYLMFVLVASGGLLATADLAQIAKEFKVAKVPVEFFGIAMTALNLAIVVDRVLNGLTRPFFGWVSDRIGRAETMFIAFGLEAIGIVLLLKFATDPILFIMLSGLVFFAWGEIYSLFPATCGDLFGSRFATANAGLLYTAKGTASLLVPLAVLVAEGSGGWNTVFTIAAALNIIAALLALLVLRPIIAAARRAAAKAPAQGL